MVNQAPDTTHARPPFAIGAIAALAIAALALHLVTLAVTPFGVHRDEFLYFAMGEHFELWSMDFPPAIAVLANASRALFGDSLAAARVFPALEGTLLLVLAAAFARELGGGRYAQVLTALAVLAAPIFQRASTLFQPVVLDQLTWTLALLALTRLGRIADGDTTRSAAGWWLALGAALGVGLLVKFSIGFIALGIAAAVLITPLRRMMATPWPWSAAAIAVAVGSPSVVGQVVLGFPVVGYMKALHATQLVRMSAAAFVGEQPMLVGPLTFAVAALGLAALLTARSLRVGRPVAVACLVAVGMLIALHGKAYYAGPVYPALVAAGATTLERWRPRRVGAAVRGTVAAAIGLFGAVAVPAALPLLPVAATAAYTARLAGDAALRTNVGDILRLPQDFADMLPWEAQARAIAAVYQGLPLSEREEAVVLAESYGEAGAAEFYQARYGLPPVVSADGSYWFFGPGVRPGRVAIVIGDPRDVLELLYDDVRQVARVRNEWTVREESDVPILVARRPRTTLQAVWPKLDPRR